MLPLWSSVLTAMAAVAALASHALSFPLPPRKAIPRIGSRARLPPREGRAPRRVFGVRSEPDDDDGGWGEDIPPPPPSAASSEERSRRRELEGLRDDLAAKRSDPGGASTGAGGGEADLFIPIVAVVSVVGFAGLYGYETLRLYSRGELYLPWGN